MLADAGVAVLVLDVTNAVRYWDEWAAIFEVMHMPMAANIRRFKGARPIPELAGKIRFPSAPTGTASNWRFNYWRVWQK